MSRRTSRRSPRRNEKARVDRLLEGARHGEIHDRGGEEHEEISAARVRAPLYRAHDIARARLLAGIAEEWSEEAEAGEILRAEADVDLHEVRSMMRGYLEAMRDAPRG